MTNKSSTYNTCKNTRAQVFIQYKCEIDGLEKGGKYDKLSFVTISVLFACFIFAMMVHYLSETSHMDEKKYDNDVITAADFTIEMEITDEMYASYLENQYHGQGENEIEDSGNKYSSALYLKKYLKNDIQELLDEVHKYKLEKDPTDKALKKRKPAQVRQIEFAYKNYKLINLLKLRGTAIINLDWKQLKEYDDKITELLANPEETKKLVQPVVAFITFESDDYKNEALLFQKKSFFNRNKNLDDDMPIKTICNQIPVFKSAPEPTNIIWENRHVSGFNY